MLGKPALSKTSVTGVLSYHLMWRSPEAAQVKSVELFGVSAIDSPGLTGVEESGQHYRTVDLQLGDETVSSLVPDSFTESSKGGAGLGNPVIDFYINVHHS